jgi:hypothetical protein
MHRGLRKLSRIPTSAAILAIDRPAPLVLRNSARSPEAHVMMRVPLFLLVLLGAAAMAKHARKLVRLRRRSFAASTTKNGSPH